jgi:hypothetical protein
MVLPRHKHSHNGGVVSAPRHEHAAYGGVVSALCYEHTAYGGACVVRHAAEHIGVMSCLPLHVLAVQKDCRVAVGALLVSG